MIMSSVINRVLRYHNVPMGATTWLQSQGIEFSIQACLNGQLEIELLNPAQEASLGTLLEEWSALQVLAGRY